MRSTVVRTIRSAAVLLVVCAATLLAVRAYDARRGPPLELWHRFVPPELGADELDRADWSAYLRAEDAAFDAVRAEVTDKLQAGSRLALNRYFAGSPVHPARFSHDWNRSFVLEPDGAPRGAVVLLHGLTDSPYSMREVARLYRAHGYVAIGIRLPAHGTVPGALTEARFAAWSAATRLAVREARRRAGGPLPLHLVGYSNGGALALQYALDAIDDPALARPDRLVLISPMVGITAFARFAGLAGLPAVFPAFAKAAWLAILPEFNPFKYNSFPVNAARQTQLLTSVLQRQMARLGGAGRLAELPPVLTFQSVIDFTVSTQAVVSTLYDRLPPNGSELVLYDLNRSAHFEPLLRPSVDAALARLLPDPPRPFRATLVTNAGPDTAEVVERALDAGATSERSRPLGLSYPGDVFSLSHIALPFSPEDPLYGTAPDPAEDFGIQLGTLAKRGERGTLLMSLDSLLRMTSNPFFAYQMERIEETIAAPRDAGCGAAGARSGCRP
ncbi:MAG TPA: alpha/beta hydrolase [Myxococcota bacterium]|nr:alpha/beta hydrolase [Myxococcota bacterium]